MNGLLSAVLTAAGVVCVIALLCALLLVIADKFMAVKEDERIKKIRDCLPGANCGSCGYAGCDGYAKALIENDGVKTNLCTPGGSETAEQIAAILGVSAEEVEKLVAYVHCHGDCHTTEKKFEYSGIKSCAAAKIYYGGDSVCKYGCLGYGDCAKVCPHDAICIENGIAHIDPRKCLGCGVCENACPNHVINLIPADAPVVVACSNQEPPKVVRPKCSGACIGCGACAKACPVNAITVTAHLAQINYETCVGCGYCAHVCRTNAIELYNIIDPNDDDSDLLDE